MSPKTSHKTQPVSSFVAHIMRKYTFQCMSFSGDILWLDVVLCLK